MQQVGWMPTQECADVAHERVVPRDGAVQIEDREAARGRNFGTRAQRGGGSSGQAALPAEAS
jgi:hypothetical protein